MDPDTRPPLRFIIQPPVKVNSHTALHEISTFLQDFQERSELHDDPGRAENSAVLKISQLGKLMSALAKGTGQPQGRSPSKRSLSSASRSDVSCIR